MASRRGRTIACWGLILSVAVGITAGLTCRDRILVQWRLWRSPKTIFAALVAPGMSDEDLLEISRSAMAGDIRMASVSQTDGVETLPARAGLFEVLRTVAELRVSQIEALKVALPLASDAGSLLLERAVALAAMPPESLGRMGPRSAGGVSFYTISAEAGGELAEIASWLNDRRAKVRRAAAGAVILACMRPLLCRPYFRHLLKESLEVPCQGIQAVLLNAAEDGDRTTACRAALALYLAGTWTGSTEISVGIRAAALGCLDDADPVIRQSAALWAYFRGSNLARAARVLVETLNVGWLTPLELARVLDAGPQYSAVEVCRKLLDDPQQDVAARAALLLAILSDQEVMGAKETLATAKGPLQESAAKALEAMTPLAQARLEAEESWVKSIIEGLQGR